MQQTPLQAKIAAQKQQQQKQEGDLKLQIAQQVAKKKLAILKAQGEKKLQQESELDESKKMFPGLDDSIESHHKRMVHSLTQYDRKRVNRKDYNHYALGHYLNGAQRATEHMKAGVEPKEAIKKVFNGPLLTRLQKHLGLDENLIERDNEKHPVEYYDARERESKAKWHYSRVGKNKNASFKKGIENDYKAQLLRKGVVDSDGKQKPLERKTNQFKQEPFVHDHERKSSHGTKVLHGVSFREEEIAEREIVSGEKYGRANHWYRQHLNRYRMYLKKGDLAKAETHRRKAQEYKRRSYIALDNPEKQLHID
jgi:hypothetical protein